MACAGLVGLALAGCSSGKGVSSPTGAGPSSSAAAAATTSAPTTTTTVAVTTTQPAGGPYATFTTPDAAAAQLVAAWRKGDRGLAAQAAVPSAVDALFAQPAPATAPEDRGCNGGLGGVASCFFRVGQNGLQIQLADSGPTHWRVQQVAFIS